MSMYWYLQVLKKYAEFGGRARRKEYWMFVLFNIIFSLVALILDNIVGTAIEGVGYGLFYILYALFILIPGLAVSVRRLHDVGKSGWMILIALIPLAGAIWLLILMVTDSVPGTNQYGPNPKTGDSGENLTGNVPLSTATQDSTTGDTIILLAVIWIFISRLIWTVLPKLIAEMFSTGWFKILNGFMGVVWALVPLGLAFAVKDKSKQVVLFILGGIYLLYGLYEAIAQLIR